MQPPVDARHELVVRSVAGLHEHIERERTERIRRGQAMPGRSPPRATGGLFVVDDVATDTSLDERHSLLGHALVVEAGRLAGLVRRVVDDGHQLRADDPPRLVERAILLHGEGGEADVAERLEQVRHGIWLEDDRIVARIDGHRPTRVTRLLGRLSSDGCGIDVGHVDRRRRRIARLAVAAHRDRDEVPPRFAPRPRPRPGC